SSAQKPSCGGSEASSDARTSMDQPPAKLSGFAQKMSALKSLEQSDPAKAKQVLSDIASKIKDAAQNATGAEADRLNAIADKFQKAADSGDLSQLGPQQHRAAQGSQSAQGGAQAAHGHHHHHHAKAQQAYSGGEGGESAGAVVKDAIDSALSAV